MNSENKAVFLDRDGVLIEDVHYLSKLEQVSIFDDVPKSLSLLSQNGFKLILVSNQSGVARGYFDEAFVQKTHKHLNQLLADHNVKLDATYYCPHHIAGNDPYNIKCACRKPAPGMILKAAQEHRIDVSMSYVIGDKTSDIELAENTGCKGILVTTGHGSEHSSTIRSKFPHIPIVNSFSEAVAIIINHS